MTIKLRELIPDDTEQVSPVRDEGGGEAVQVLLDALVHALLVAVFYTFRYGVPLFLIKEKYRNSR